MEVDEVADMVAAKKIDIDINMEPDQVNCAKAKYSVYE